MLDKIVHCFSLFSVMLLGRCCYCQCIFLSLLLIFLPRLLMLVLGAFFRWLSFFCWMLDIFVFSTKYVFHVPLMGGCFRGWGFFCPLCTWFFCAWFKSVFLLRSLYFAAIICGNFCVNIFSVFTVLLTGSRCFGWRFWICHIYHWFFWFLICISPLVVAGFVEYVVIEIFCVICDVGGRLGLFHLCCFVLCFT